MRGSLGTPVSQAPLTRRNLMRGTALGAAAAAGAGTLTACAPSAGGGAGGKTTLTIMAPENEFSPEFLKTAEAQLDLTIKRVEVDNTKLTAMLASGTAPDLVRGLGAVETPYFVARDLALDLDDYFASSELLKADDLDPVNDVWRYDGTVQGQGPRYGMAKDYSQDAMFWYNTALFDAAGLAYPSETEPVTYDAWLDMGRELTQKDGGTTTVYGLSAGGLGLFISLANMTASAGGSLLSEDLGTVDFSSPEAQQTLTWYLEYARAKVGFSPVEPNPDGWDWPPYQTGRLAQTWSGYWFGGAIAAEPELAATSRLAPAPTMGGERISPCFGATGYWIPKASKHHDDAWRLFEWFMGGDPAKERAAGGWGLPSLLSLRADLPTGTPAQEQALAAAEAEADYFKVLSFSPYVKVEALDAVLNQYLPDAINEGVSAGALADTLNTDMQALLDEGKELVK
ncbi:extracellular solute-binding protein [Glycomyces tritici]|uniref:Extracellular solute-binding protein n=1 Tax=Glycomyces tritici TaxID=2665176 RepID=A0ABT7YL96_9ACTN|nr:extracellular solute-binding protein [Glycomyces tritici]MDN3239058.1 extracellular solute-binding protein [Glycomyces tritici]MDN3240220.1 extracellular solute-binding protein [Glycomyces tritici]